MEENDQNQDNQGSSGPAVDTDEAKKAKQAAEVLDDAKNLLKPLLDGGRFKFLEEKYAKLSGNTLIEDLFK